MSPGRIFIHECHASVADRRLMVSRSCQTFRSGLHCTVPARQKRASHMSCLVPCNQRSVRVTSVPRGVSRLFIRLASISSGTCGRMEVVYIGTISYVRLSRANDEVCQGTTGLSSFQIGIYLLLRCSSTLRSTFVTLIRSNDQLIHHYIHSRNVPHPRRAMSSRPTGLQSSSQLYCETLVTRRS